MSGRAIRFRRSTMKLRAPRLWNAMCAKNPAEVARLLKACHALLPARGTVAKPLRLMILGIPNVGKSTLMNALLKRRLAQVGGDDGGVASDFGGGADGDDLTEIEGADAAAHPHDERHVVVDEHDGHAQTLGDQWQ